MNLDFNKIEDSSIWSSALKGAKRLVGPLIRVVPLITGSRSRGWIKAIFVFTRIVFALMNSQGQRGTALKLKVTKLLLEKWLSGDHGTTPHSLGVAVARTRTGLPRLIPAHHRDRIRSGDLGTIRLWLGLLTLYRVMSFDGRHSLLTVLRPGVTLSPSLLVSWSNFCGYFWWQLKSVLGVIPPKLGTTPKGSTFFPELKAVLAPLLKSGPNSPWSWSAADPENKFNSSRFFVDSAMWRSARASWSKMISICQLFGSQHLIQGDHAPFVYNLATSIDLETSPDRTDGKKTPSGEPYGGVRELNGRPVKLGALATKREPGKIRVFAMVDSLTQWVLRPLHMFLFKRVLKNIPQDGLYDQIAPAKRLVKVMRSEGHSRVWSYDLSAATDRLPLLLQEIVLKYILNIKGASLWAWLIADRYFRLPAALRDSVQGQDRSLFPVREGVRYYYARYAVGQPMGAYSSWAMLAITHHAIVQYCASLAGISGWFELYAVLGDDVVIGHPKVARKYIWFMEQVGVPINRHKSIVGRDLSFEFAKRFFWRGEDITPLPLSGFTGGWLGLSAVPEIVNQVMARGLKVSLYSIFRYVGIGFKQASKIEQGALSSWSGRARALWLMLSIPGGPYSVQGLQEWYTQTRKGVSVVPSVEVLVSWATSVRSRLSKYDLDFLIKRAKKALKAYEPVGEGKFMYDEALTWWRKEVRSEFLDPFKERIADVQLALVELAHIRVTGIEAIQNLYTQLKDLEDLFALLPGQLKAKRRQSRQQLPARVREWKRIQKVIN